jgi:hypothetical protein
MIECYHMTKRKGIARELNLSIEWSDIVRCCKEMILFHHAWIHKGEKGKYGSGFKHSSRAPCGIYIQLKALCVAQRKDTLAKRGCHSLRAL